MVGWEYRQILIYFGSLSDKFVGEFVHGTIATKNAL